MCLDILRDPGSAVKRAKGKKAGMNKTVLTLIESAVVFAIAAAIVSVKTNAAFAVGAGISVFIFTIIGALILGYAIQIIAVTLGGKGKYYEGLTTMVYPLVPMSAAALIAAILSWIPFGAGFALAFIVLLFGVAAGVATVYRGVKELFKTDMITAFVAVSVLTLALIVAVMAAGFLGLGTLGIGKLGMLGGLV